MGSNGRGMVRRPMAELSQMLDRSKATIAKVAEKGTDMERLFGLVRFVMGQDKGLMSVLNSQEGVLSVVRATTKLAQLGLEPTGKHGGAYLVKYGQSVQVLPDWRSFRDAAIESGAATDVYAVSVHKNDEYEYGVRGGLESFVHRVDPFSDRGERVGWMFVAILPNGNPAYLPVTMEQINRRKAQGNSGTWRQWPDEMERKTVIRMGCDQRLSVRNSRKLADLIAADDAAEVGSEVAPDPVIEIEIAPEPETRTEALRHRLSQHVAEPDVSPEPLPSTPPKVEVEVEVVETQPEVLPAEPPPARVDVLCPECESTANVQKPQRKSKTGDLVCTDSRRHASGGCRFWTLQLPTESEFGELLDLVASDRLDSVASGLRSVSVPDDQSLWSDSHGQRAVGIVKAILGSQEVEVGPPEPEPTPTQGIFG
jgi:recombination protein RecT